MLSKTSDFLRIADIQPSHEMVVRRTESAAEIVAHICQTEQHKILLDLVQGIVNGF